MKEPETIHIAFEKLTELTGAVVKPLKTNLKKNGIEIDAMVEIIMQKIKRVFYIEIKNEIRISNLPALEKLKAVTDRDLLLVCQYIPMPLKRTLKQHHINYLEAAGNCYIETPGLFLFVNDQQVTKARIPTDGKLWKAAGLKFMFTILTQPDKINDPYRKIAEESGIALGNVGGYLKELKNEGFLKEGLEKNVKTNFIENRERLVQRWAEAYITNLRPKQIIGNFRFTDRENMRNWETLNGTFKWGGENAGAILTGYLGPEKFTIYTTETRNKLMQKLKLVPDPNGPIELVHQFWTEKEEPEPNKTVPPLLAYAELITSFDSRNRETAERIKTQYLD